MPPISVPPTLALLAVGIERGLRRTPSALTSAKDPSRVEVGDLLTGWKSASKIADLTGTKRTRALAQNWRGGLIDQL